MTWDDYIQIALCVIAWLAFGIAQGLQRRPGGLGMRSAQEQPPKG
jgi:hypothetical protein